MKIPEILIGGSPNPQNGWAVILAGGSASGKSSLIKDGRLKFSGETLSTDTLGEEIIEVHNNAAKYAKEDPSRLKEAEKLICDGLKSRYPDTTTLNKVQNLVLDLDAKTISTAKVSTLLSNGAHAQKESYFRKRISHNAENGMENMLLDMTGKEREVKLYTDILKQKGYKVALVWVITNRSQALLWNLLRPRSMKVGAVHTGHDEPNRYLLDALQDERANDFDDAWLVFKSTESLQRAMNEFEIENSAIRLKKKKTGFEISEELINRVKSVLGPSRPNAEGENCETPQWQKDETGKKTILITPEFIQKYTQEVLLEDGTRARALLQLRSSYDKKNGGLIVCDTDGTPKLQKCNQDDTPTYPYVIIREEDQRKKVQRRHGLGSKYKLKYEKRENPDAEKYVSDTWTYTFMNRYRMMLKVARDHQIECPPITDILVSFLEKDKKETEKNIKKFYAALEITEPTLPKTPKECYDVQEPLREQFLGRNGDELFEEAVRLYPKQKQTYQKSLKEWIEYEKNFE